MVSDSWEKVKFFGWFSACFQITVTPNEDEEFNRVIFDNARCPFPVTGGDPDYKPLLPGLGEHRITR